MEEADRDLVLEVVYTEYARVPARDRQRCHWVMDAEMWRMIRQLKGPAGDYLWVPLPDANLLLSLPVEIRDGAEGARLEEGAA
jgi:HK97 family phage major capsid protein